MSNRTKTSEAVVCYTLAQFDAATVGLRKIIGGLENLMRPKNGATWEVSSVIDIDGTRPVATARASVGGGKTIAISVGLQDDGGDPYAVVDVRRWRHDEEKKWHSAAVVLGVERLYPHQFDAIPYLVKWLAMSEPPCPARVCLEEGGMEKLSAPFTPSPEAVAAFDEAEAAREKEIAANPDNGKIGWWSVMGLRHSAMAHASSAKEAIEKARDAGLVHDWESAIARFVGESLPDVF